MKNPIFFFALFFCFQIHAQVGIGTTTPHESSILDVESTDKGMLIPRLTSTERDAINPPADALGLLVYDRTTESFWYFDGTEWIEIKTDYKGWMLDGNAVTDNTSFLGTTTDYPLNFRVNDIRAGHISENNLFFGISSGVAVTNLGVKNTAVGHEALVANTNGKRNTTFGYQTLHKNSTGFDNVAVGYQALYNNTNLDGNTAIGSRALYNNTHGENNVANGFQALYSNTTGNYNVANGSQALYRNTTGSNNIANGYQSLFNNTTGSNNVANGPGALHNNIDGRRNVANGYQALYSNISGGYNVANGSNALFSNETGSNNVATGSNALSSNTSGSGNTAYGSQSLENNTVGRYNVANGRQALLKNVSGNSNVAIGYYSLQNNIDGEFSIGIGNSALKNNKYGARNIAIGQNALGKTENPYTPHPTPREGYNVAIGSGSLHNNITGKNNTALGSSTDVLSTDLENTIVIGYNAKVGGNYAIAIGNRAEARGENSMALGMGAEVTADNTIRLGNDNISRVETKGDIYANGVLLTSDARFKHQVQDNVPGLSFITKLNPVTYYLDDEKLNEFKNSGIIKNSWSDIEGEERRTGFLAQEVEQVAREIGYEFDGVNKPQNDKDNYSLAYSTFVVPLVKAVQEQQELIESQNARIAELEAQQKELVEVVENQQAQQKQLVEVIDNQQAQIESINQRLDTFFVADKD